MTSRSPRLSTLTAVISSSPVTVPPADLAELARAAAGCQALSRARRLAAWVGPGRPVTAKEVLRPVDVAAAAAGAGLPAPGKVRTAADVPELHLAWLAARSARWLVIGGGRAVGTCPADSPAESTDTAVSPGTDGTDTDASMLNTWATALEEVCRSQSRDRNRAGVLLACHLLLSILSEQPSLRQDEVAKRLRDRLYDLDWMSSSLVLGSFSGSMGRFDSVLRLLESFAAVDSGADRVALTPLGRWLHEVVRASQVTPSLPAAELVARLVATDSSEQVDMLLAQWTGERDSIGLLTELLRAAADAGPAARGVVVEAVICHGPEMLPAMMAVRDLPTLAPHAVDALFAHGLGDEPDATQTRWLRTEFLLAILHRYGTQAVLDEVTMVGGLARAVGGGHPDEPELREAIHAVLEAGGRPRALRLKVELDGWRPRAWRRVRIPAAASLADLHLVIQALFGWDGDHLHAFTAENGLRFGDIDEAEDEDSTSLYRVLPRVGSRLDYLYDFGASWKHTVTLEGFDFNEAADAVEAGPLRIVCLAGKGDAPVEYWNPEDSEPGSVPFDSEEINKRLAELVPEQDDVGTDDAATVDLAPASPVAPR